MISVIITTYCRERLFQRCIKSLLGQPLVTEIIVVDDGCSPLVQRYVRYLNKVHSINVVYSCTLGRQGACVARNQGVALAKNNFVSFVDDDDYVLPNRYACLANLLKENKYSFYSMGRITDINYGKRIFVSPGQIYGEIDFNSLSVGNHIDIGIVCTKSNFLSVDGFDSNLRCFHDWNLAVKLIKKHGDAYKVDKNSYVVNEDENIQRITTNANHYNGYLQFIDDFSDILNWRQKALLKCEASSKSNKITKFDILSLPFSAITYSSIPIKRTIKKLAYLLRKNI